MLRFELRNLFTPQNLFHIYDSHSVGTGVVSRRYTRMKLTTHLQLVSRFYDWSYNSAPLSSS
jgi:hypothetical protein